jgi:hypothetical protein
MHHAPDIRATPIEVQQLDDARRGAAVAAAALSCVVHGAVDPRLQAEAAHLRSVLLATAEALAAMRASVRLDLWAPAAQG